MSQMVPTTELDFKIYLTFTFNWAACIFICQIRQPYHGVLGHQDQVRRFPVCHLRGSENSPAQPEVGEQEKRGAAPGSVSSDVCRKGHQQHPLCRSVGETKNEPRVLKKHGVSHSPPNPGEASPPLCPAPHQHPSTWRPQ